MMVNTVADYGVSENTFLKIHAALGDRVKAHLTESPIKLRNRDVICHIDESMLR